MSLDRRTIAAYGSLRAVILLTTASVAWAQPCVRKEIQKLTASDAAAGHRLGASVSIDGDLAVVGAWNADEGGIISGAAYVFRWDPNCLPPNQIPGCWVEEVKLIALEAALGDWFGWDVSVSGDHVIVGARFHFVDSQSGAAFVFQYDQNDTPSDPADDFWVQEPILIADDGQLSDDFGYSVSIHDGWAIVGAPKDDDACLDDAGCNSGSAYVFRHDHNGTELDPSDDFWVQEAKLTASDAEPGDNFGFSVSIYGDHAVVGAWRRDEVGLDSGAAYVFRRDDNGSPLDPDDDFWVQEDKLLPTDLAARDNFGFAVANNAERAVVGSWLDDDLGNLSGSAYVFRHDANDTPLDPDDDFWIEEFKLLPADGTAGDEFGKDVSIDGDWIAVGAYEDDDACAQDPDPDPDCDSGSAYVFRRSDNGTPLDASDDVWIQTTKLVGSDSDAGDFFGRVAISDGRVITGSVDDAAGENAGAAYIFAAARSCSDLVDFAGLQLCFGLTGELFGCQVFDIDGDSDVDLEDVRRLLSTLTGP